MCKDPAGSTPPAGCRLPLTQPPGAQGREVTDPRPFRQQRVREVPGDSAGLSRKPLDHIMGTRGTQDTGRAQAPDARRQEPALSTRPGNECPAALVHGAGSRRGEAQPLFQGLSQNPESAPEPGAPPPSLSCPHPGLLVATTQPGAFGLPVGPEAWPEVVLAQGLLLLGLSFPTAGSAVGRGKVVDRELHKLKARLAWGMGGVGGASQGPPPAES